MALKLRPTGLGSGIDKDRPDYTVYCGEWDVGRIYQTRGGPDSLRWFWSLTVNRSDGALGQGGDLGGGQGAVSKSWDAWKAWAELEEVALTIAVQLEGQGAVISVAQHLLGLKSGGTSPG